MIELDIEIKSKHWLKEFDNNQQLEDFINQICNQLLSLIEELSSFTKNNRILSIAFSLSSNNQIKEINHKFRGKKQPTNVLSFNNLDHQAIKERGFENIIKNQDFLFLGDIVIAYEISKEESENQNKTFKNHLTHLVLHSILHLIGYDHIDDKQAQNMEELEAKILDKINIPNPY